jgi:hypothetical protein
VRWRRSACCPSQREGPVRYNVSLLRTPSDEGYASRRRYVSVSTCRERGQLGLALCRVFQGREGILMDTGPSRASPTGGPQRVRLMRRSRVDGDVCASAYSAFMVWRRASGRRVGLRGVAVPPSARRGVRRYSHARLRRRAQAPHGPLSLPANRRSRRPDSNRGPLLHEEGPVGKRTVSVLYGPGPPFVDG